MTRTLIAGLACAAVILGAQGISYALKTVSFTVEGENALVNISRRDVNLIKFPLDDIKAYTRSRALDVKVNGRNVLVSYSGVEEEAEVVGLLFVTPAGAYSMLLRAADIPPETIIVQLPPHKLAAADSDQADFEANGLCSRTSGYIQTIKELMKAMYTEASLSGYSIRKDLSDSTERNGVRLTLVMAYKGILLEGERYRVVNQTGRKMELKENDFHRQGVMAVSIERHELEPGEETSVYIVKKPLSRGQGG